jgi:hypothetical protein
MKTIMRIIVALVLALSLTTLTVPSFAQEAPAGFDALPYIGRGDAFNCADFVSQAAAQAVLRADPTDPNRLDQGGIPGVACESNKAPKDMVPVAP